MRWLSWLALSLSTALTAIDDLNALRRSGWDWVQGDPVGRFKIGLAPALQVLSLAGAALRG